MVQVGLNAAFVEFHGKRIRLPAHAGPALRFMHTAEAPFTAADLPGPLDTDGALTLARRLLREGLITTRPS